MVEDIHDRKLAEDGASQIGRLLGDARRPWTHGAHLPGGDLGAHGVDIAGYTAALSIVALERSGSWGSLNAQLHAND